MAKRRSINKNQNHDGDNRWSDLNHDVLLLVMMQLGFVDFLGFSGVCKSWRSVAVSNKKKFLESRPPMVMWIKSGPDKNECYLRDFDRRKLKTLFPRSVGRHCVGLTCGYLVTFGDRTHDFWLVNPITNHELYFPTIYAFEDVYRARAVLVFSPSTSVSGWVLVMTTPLSNKIWFSIAGTGAWKYVSFAFPILDLHAFDGKVYTLHRDWLHGGWRLCEMTFDPDPKLTLLEIKDFSKPHSFQPKFVSASEKLYVVDRIPGYLYRVHWELDLGEMKWVLPEEETIGEYSFFLNLLSDGAAANGAAVELESRPAVPRSRYYDWFPHTPDKNQKGGFFTTKDHMWYFLHECMSVNHIHE